ncbi:RHS repeat-associated core domain-containing protein [Paenibacillus sp. UNC499MF]|nr:RHS repeat-associated core domain-containing protein [Paenibacillus sp. UNC499MF]
MSNNFRYSGEYWDNTTKLQYLRARWYDPNLGRFINEDTYEGQLDNPLSLNLYTYTHNNPLRYTDPSGHKVFLIHGTFANPEKNDGKSTWTSEFVDYVRKLFNEPVKEENWTGENNTKARSEAAQDIFNDIYQWHLDNPYEPIRLVAHSHGGNVGIMITNLLAEKDVKVDTLITIATPVREYKLETEVGQHIQVYNKYDGVQNHGGSLPGGGAAYDREFKGAENVEVKLSLWYYFRPIQSHSVMHTNIDIWKKYIVPILN